MNENQKQFLHDMIKDSLQLEQTEEPGQAFDKLMRGFESRFNLISGETQGEKSRSFLLQHLDAASVWKAFEGNARGINYFTEELSYAIRDRAEKNRLNRIASNFQEAMSRKQKTDIGKCFSDLTLFLRNRRFHGYPDFSGRNIRVALSVKYLLALMRSVIQNEITSNS